ncbi:MULTISPECIES: flagellin [Mameliella]|jgi:flagellin|uniref:flagellin N-terminal helical domain-containing protein n=1 Tax=Mameliella TaxID=1434019 RepID=UPI0008411FEB|nr:MULTISPECIES: flagellin [Mameliella]ODM47482.1 flagellin [Ruegeria sp. PBVC088]MBY6121042.1 flagellin [Mameliella alba]MDD9729728.1 flagellin [Mameliella sp. AT18]OWV41984.1 flagellin [Mameliella alba]OWV47478.1 flagellin [Mameliella alba]
MSSINSNPGATAALQTLKAINASMGDTQMQIATGKKVASSQDNAAVWAISKVMEADVQGFQKVSDSLSLGQATISVARQGAETVTELLTEVKGKIVAAQEENVDRAKIQTDIDALRDQISSIVSAAQFNGQAMLTNTDQTAGSGGINVLSSLNRTMDGVTSSDIRVSKQDLGQGQSSIGSGLTALAGAANDITGTGDGAAATMTGNATAPTGTTTFGAAATTTVAAGTGFSVEITATAGNGPSNTADRNDISYVARDGDTMEDVAAGLAAAFNKYVSDDLGAGNEGTIDATASGNQITFTGADQGGDNFSITVQQYDPDATTTIGGGLAELGNIDVTTQAGADSALAEIEGLIQTSIDAAAAFGSAEMRLDTQKDFVSGLTDALKSGIGTLVDADLEEVSAKLQAQQVQQQLAMQALSIANRAPQSLLSLFR